MPAGSVEENKKSSAKNHPGAMSWWTNEKMGLFDAEYRYTIINLKQGERPCTPVVHLL
jgi:hypothetical protein